MGFRLNWQDNNLGEEGHRVYRSLTPMNQAALPPPLAVLGPDVTSWDDTDIQPSTTYYYRVSAFVGDVEAVGDEVMATSAAGLEAPVNVAVVLVDGDEPDTKDALVSWADLNTRELGHRIYRASAPMNVDDMPEPVAELGPNITAWEDPETPQGQIVYYRVSAFNNREEVFSDEVSVDTSVPVEPVTPGRVTTSGDIRITTQGFRRIPAGHE